MNIFENAINFINDIRESHISNDILYIRNKDKQEYRLKATIGSSTFESIEETGLVFNVKSVDFIVKTLPFTPERLDKIIFANREFEVFPIANNPCFIYCDNLKKSMRVRTKEVVK